MRKKKIRFPVKLRTGEAKRIFLAAAQNQGVRNRQEDSFGISSLDKDEIRKKGVLAVVADGMGGLSDGKVASSCAVNALIDAFHQEEIVSDIPAWFSQKLNSVNRQIAEAEPECGTTVAAVVCGGEGIYWFSVGDSRVYLCRGGRIFRMSEDTDYERRLLDRVIDGEATADDLENEEQIDSLTAYVGAGGELIPDGAKRPFQVRRGDRLLICSDGVYNALTQSELLALLERPAKRSAGEIERKILRKAHSGQDNFTLLILQFE